MADSITQNKGIKKNNLTQARGTLTRSTHELKYFFVIPAISFPDNIDATEKFRIILRQLFGDRIDQNKFYHFGYKKMNWRGSPPSGTPFNFFLFKSIIDEVGLFPLIKPYAVTNEAGNSIPDTYNYDQLMDITQKFHQMPKDIEMIFGEGADFQSLKYWRRYDPMEQLQLISKLQSIADIVYELDDEALLGIYDERKNLISRGGYAKIRDYDLDRLVLSLEQKREESSHRSEKEELLQVEQSIQVTSLVGLEELYFKIKELVLLEVSEYGLVDVVHFQSGGPIPKVVKPSPQLVRLSREVDHLYKLNSLDYAKFHSLQKKFLKSFEKRATNFIKKQLYQHLRLLEIADRNTNLEIMAAEIQSNQMSYLRRIFSKESLTSYELFQKSLQAGNSEFEALKEKFPVIRYINFWTLYYDAFLKKDQGKVFNSGKFRILINATKQAIRKEISNLKSSSYVWKADKMLMSVLAHFELIGDPNEGQTYNGMVTDLVNHKLQSERSSGILKGLALAVIGLALSLSGIGILVAIGIAISIADVVNMIEDQSEISNRHIAGLSTQNPPSDFWILIAIAGLGLDLAPFIKAGSKTASVWKSTEEFEHLLKKLHIINDKALDAVKRMGAIKKTLDNAKMRLVFNLTDYGKAGYLTVELVEVAYLMIRMKLTKFRHFMLELARSGHFGKAYKRASYEVLMRDLDPKVLRLLKETYGKALKSRKLDLLRVKEIDELLPQLEKQYQKVLKEKSDIWHNHRNPSTRSDPNSPYHKLKPKHDQLRKEAEDLNSKLKALKVQRKTLAAKSQLTDAEYGEIAELAIIKKYGWPQLDSTNVKAIDAVKSVKGQIHAMQSKALIHPSGIADLEKKVFAKIRATKRNLNSDKYTRLVDQFNNNTLRISADELGFELPRNWRDPSMTIHLEIPIIQRTPMQFSPEDINTIGQKAFQVMEKEFPQHSKLHIRFFTVDEVLNILLK